MSKEHRLDLINNSISYFREAILYAQRGIEDSSQWKFAIVHLMQAMELAFKEALRRIHPILVYENIDNPKHSVSITQALQRLRNPKIGNLSISAEDNKSFIKAIQLRNELSHYEFNYTAEYAESKFADVFTFMIFFYRQHLALDTEVFFSHQEYLKIMELVKTKKKLLDRADQYIKEGNFLEVWQCTECGEDTFIAAEEQCCFCHHKDCVVLCPNCGCETCETELISLFDFFDHDYDEGISRVYSNFGYDCEYGCPSCIKDIKEDIEGQRRSQYYEDMMMEEYYRRKEA